MSADVAPGSPPRIALLGNYPPRMCGIATFTADVRAALVKAYPASPVDVYAMDDGLATHVYPAEVVDTIAQGDRQAYQDAAARIEANADLLLVQHEYGIFGGAAGDMLLDLLAAVSCPVVVTLHTVLEAPDADQRRVLDALAVRASTMIVMAEKGRELLVRVHDILAEAIVVIPHGVPDRPLIEPAAMKPRFGFETRPVVLTFGLLSPNKGIETIIRAMPAIVAEHADALYVVLGATHPNLVAHEGEAYREGLIALAAELGVVDNVRLVDGYVETPLLLDYLAAADVYATPYLNEAQITSGTLSYAVAVGKPVVSTPYWHAVELLAEGIGILCPFGDADAFARAIGGLLSNEATRIAMRKRAWTRARTMTWQKLAEAYMRELRSALALPATPVRTVVTPLIPAVTTLTAQSLVAVERMTDSCGMFQHAIGHIPDRRHGYCVDDNARALTLMHRIDAPLAERADVLAIDYAAFVQHSWNPDLGRFRNFMSYARAWLEGEGSEDSSGRALWSLGLTASEARDEPLRDWARALFTEAAPRMMDVHSPRAQGFCILAADAVLDAEPGHLGARDMIACLGPNLHRIARACMRPDWAWYETHLAYDNARLPQAMLRAASRLDEQPMHADALATLGWLCEVQTGAGGVFRAFGSTGLGRDGDRDARFDQQPLEAWATVDACAVAWDLTGDARWLSEAHRAQAWFGGRNELGLVLTTPDGGCRDGLAPTGLNRNEGAESILSALHASAALARLDKAAMRARTQARLVARAR